MIWPALLSNEIFSLNNASRGLEAHLAVTKPHPKETVPIKNSWWKVTLGSYWNKKWAVLGAWTYVKLNPKNAERNAFTFLRAGRPGSDNGHMETMPDFFTKSLKGSNANLNPQFLHYFKGNLHSACLSHVICLKGVCDNRIQNGKTRRKNISWAVGASLQRHVGNSCLSLSVMESPLKMLSSAYFSVSEDLVSRRTFSWFYL